MVVGGGDRHRENRLYLETHDVCSRENQNNLVDRAV
jgi:hypothetical protein